jgi:hypothetical protein
MIHVIKDSSSGHLRARLPRRIWLDAWIVGIDSVEVREASIMIGAAELGLQPISQMPRSRRSSRSYKLGLPREANRDH